MSSPTDMRGHVMGIGHLSESRPVAVELHAAAGGVGYLTAGLFAVVTIGGYPSRTITRNDLRTLGGVEFTRLTSVTTAELFPSESGWVITIVPL